MSWLLLAGAVRAAGALLVLAGAGKMAAVARGIDTDSAVRRLLRAGPAGWRRAELATGALECATGVVVCAGWFPVAGGAVMAVLGAVFAGLLTRARRRRLPGGCGCLPWRWAGRADVVTWRSIARAVALLGAGVLDLAARRPGPPPLNRLWFDAGVAAGGAVLAALTMELPPRTPRGHRPLWWPARLTLRSLVRHPVFAATAEAAGPFWAACTYRRAGCVAEFWFHPVPPSAAAAAALFRVTHLADGALSVQASVCSAGPAQTGHIVWLNRHHATGPVARMQRRISGRRGPAMPPAEGVLGGHGENRSPIEGRPGEGGHGSADRNRVTVGKATAS
jgi:hypothetical protein